MFASIKTLKFISTALIKTWTRTLKNLDPKKPGPWETWTQNKLDPEPWETWTKKNLDTEKPGPWKAWALKNLDFKNPESWKTWNKYLIKKYV